jgi:hypothetical protein
MLTLKVMFTALVLVGLLLTLVGAMIAARAIIITPSQAIEIGVSRIAADKMEDNIDLPAVQNLLKQSRAAAVGLALVAFGTLLQITGTVPTLFYS